MRSAIVGAYFHDDVDKRREFVAAATRLTHTDPKAETAALAMAEAASWSMNQNETIQQWLHRLTALSPDQEWQTTCRKLAEALAAQKSVMEFADSLGLQRGVTGYAYHSVPVALYAWLRHQNDFRAALEAALNCGGDTDTVGACVGALVGAGVGRQGLPVDWIKGITDWPRSPSLLEKIAAQLAHQKGSAVALGPVRNFWPGVLLRNLLFLVVVLVHGFRRLAPPY
jgi:ADP-ribosylglycohydrolase